MPNTFLQTIQFVGADTDGNVETFNAGKDDDGTPLYYELETQELEFGNKFHKKNIGGIMAVFSDNAFDSKLQIKTDDKDYQSFLIKLEDRVNLSKSIDYNGNKFKLKWMGNTTNTVPVFEGFKVEDITDYGIVK